MGLHHEFNKAVEFIQSNVTFDADINVSVFETNIRVVGGLLSAHMLSHRYVSCSIFITKSLFINQINTINLNLFLFIFPCRATKDLEMGWPCNGPLLRMAEDVARRLLPAFDTPTGMPYGTVNLRYGVPQGETTVTCTAGVGTFILEFGTLTRLTGDTVFEEVSQKHNMILFKLFSYFNIIMKLLTSMLIHKTMN